MKIAKFKVKLKKSIKQVPYENPPFDSDKLLHSTVKRNFVIEIFNIFESLSVPENSDQEEVWEARKNSFHTEITSKTTLHFRDENIAVQNRDEIF